MKIREMKPSDLERVAEFEKEIAVISFAEEAITDLEFHRKKLSEALAKDKGGMLVAVDGDVVTGWLWMAAKTDYLSREKYISFKSLYVHPGYRETGCSEDLMRAGMEFARSIRAVKIVGKVAAHNLAMRSLYKKFGFEPTFLTMEYHASTKKD